MERNTAFVVELQYLYHQGIRSRTSSAKISMFFFRDFVIKTLCILSL